MRFQKLISPAALCLTALVCLNCPMIIGQVLQPIKSTHQNWKGSVPEKNANQQDLADVGTQNDAQPYKLSSRFHLQKGTNSGYLIVKIELRKGSYIYSMTQRAPLRPSKIQVTQSNQFRLNGKFIPDRPATIIENDPIFEQRLEKHTGVVQFFAPVEIAPGVAPNALAAEMEFSGQVCDDRGFCLPISAKTTGRFAGYFERSANKRAISQTKMKIGNQPY